MSRRRRSNEEFSRIVARGYVGMGCVACVVLRGQYHPAGFSLWCTPKFVVISGSRNIEDEPEIRSVGFSYQSHGAAVFHTQIEGCVRFELTANDVTAKTFRGGDW